MARFERVPARYAALTGLCAKSWLRRVCFSNKFINDLRRKSCTYPGSLVSELESSFFYYTIKNAIFVGVVPCRPLTYWLCLVLTLAISDPPLSPLLSLNPFFPRSRNLFFPNGYRRLQCINNIAARIKRGSAMRTSYNDNHASLPNFEPSRTMCNRNAFNSPALLCLINDRLYLLTCHLFIHFIFK